MTRWSCVALTPAGKETMRYSSCNAGTIKAKAYGYLAKGQKVQIRNEETGAILELSELDTIEEMP